MDPIESLDSRSEMFRAQEVDNALAHNQHVIWGSSFDQCESVVRKNCKSTAAFVQTCSGQREKSRVAQGEPDMISNSVLM